MGRQMASACLSLPTKSSSNDNVENEELSEDEDPSEEEPCEEEELSEEEEYEEEQNEEEPSEEDTSEVSSPEGDNGEEYQSNSVISNSGENRSSADTMADRLQKRQKQDLYSVQGLNAGASGTGFQDKSKTLSCDEIVTKKLQSTEDSGKKRCSRWDTEPGADGEAVDGGDVAPKKRKSRWDSDDTQSKMLSSIRHSDFMKDHVTRELNAQLHEINRKLRSQKIVDDRPENERSRSPSPIYHDLGVQINTRAARLRAKLMIQKQKIISELVQKDPTFKPPPPNYKVLNFYNKLYKARKKFYKKLYIPIKQYPGCNFIGIIVGTRGNTKRKMQQETGAKINIRGRGSSKKLKFQQNKDAKPGRSEKEDLHVLVEADNQKSLDAAVGMVEEILFSVEKVLGSSSITLEMPTLKTSVACHVCGDVRHPTSACPLTASAPGSSTDGHQINFLSNLGGGLSPFSGPTVPSPTKPWMANPASCALPSYNAMPKKEIDEANLYVANLPHSVNEDKLIELFSPFGNLSNVKVIKDKSTGLNKGSGFVQYINPINAAKALAQMNGHKIDGKMLAVRVAGHPPPPVNLGLDVCGDVRHPTSVCPITTLTPRSSTDDHQINFISNLGGVLSPFSDPPVPSTTRPSMANPASCALPCYNAMPNTEIDEANLFVGYIPHSVNEDKLIEMFSPFGNLSEAKVIKDKSTGLSKGCGFVKYINPINAAKAMAQMNGHKIDGKMLAVRVAGRPPLPVNLGLDVCGDARHPSSACPLMASTPGSSSCSTDGHQINFLANLGGGLSPFSGPTVSSTTRPWMANPASCAMPNREIDEANLFVGYLPDSVNEDKLIELFSPFGNLSKVKIFKDKSTGLSKGCGFVKYINPINAAKAMALMNGHRIDGKMLAVRVAGRSPPPVNVGLGGSTSISNLLCPGPVAIPQVNPGSTSFCHLPPNPGPVAIPQVNPGSTSFSNLAGAQLRELATPNGRVIEEKSITLQMPTFKTVARHPTSACPLTASTPGSSTDGHQINFFGNLRGGLSPFSGPTVSSTTRPWMPNPALCALPKKEIDEAKLFVGFVPHSVNEDKLIELFSPFGNLSKVKVIKDKSTGISQGYAFVKYTDPINAAKAVALMNGHTIDGKMLTVRVTGRPPPPVNLGLGGSTSISHLPPNPGTLAIPQVNHGSVSWPGPSTISTVCGDSRYPTSACPLMASTPGSSTNGHRINFLGNLGGSLSPFSGPTVSSTTKPRMANPASCALPSYNAMPSEEIDAAHLFVGFLPNSVNEDKLIELFSPFGNLSEAKVVKDKSTGLSKGVGFVTYFDPINAAKAVAQMNGHKIDGKMLAVRVAGRPPPPVNLGRGGSTSFCNLPCPGPVAIPQVNPGSTSFSHLPPNPGPVAIPQVNPGSTSFGHLPPNPGPVAIPQVNPGSMICPGPPGSMFPEQYASSPKSNSVLMHTDPVVGWSSASIGSSSQTLVMSSLSNDVTPSREFAQVPGYLNSFNPQHHASSPKSNSFLMHADLIVGRSSVSMASSSQIPVMSSLISHDVTPSKKLAQFPGYLNSFNPQHHLYQSTTVSSLSSSQFHLTRDLGSHQIPPR